MNHTALSGIAKLAFIGSGNMATALISGLTQNGLPAARIAVADPSLPARQSLATQYGVEAHASNVEAALGADVVILAVKPQFLGEAALEIAPHLGAESPTVISIAAGIPYAALSRWLGSGVSLVRTMPNRPALNGCGATALYAPPALDAARRAAAEAIMAAVGITVWVTEESQIDTVTALSGSGPAYFFLLMEALEQAAVARGLPAEVAHRLTLQTAYGAAVMAREATDPLAVLREQVTSRGGTTAAALAVFDAADLRAIVAAALTAADRRAAELAAQFAAP